MAFLCKLNTELHIKCNFIKRCILFFIRSVHVVHCHRIIAIFNGLHNLCNLKLLFKDVQTESRRMFRISGARVSQFLSLERERARENPNILRIHFNFIVEIFSNRHGTWLHYCCNKGQHIHISTFNGFQ